MIGLARSRSSSKNNDRLQERLAKAVINRTVTKTNQNSVPSSNLPSRTASPTNGVGSPRASLDIEAERQGPPVTQYPQEAVLRSDDLRKLDHGEGRSDSGPEPQPESEGPATISSTLEISHNNSARRSMESHDSISKPPSFEMDRSVIYMDTAGSTVSDAEMVSKTQQQYNDTITQMRSDYETSEIRRQDETHFYLERIDALQSKLHYLTKEAADTARKAASEAALGSADQKLAANEEKIALLMEEGEKLSQTELRHLNTIKKLRAKMIEDERRLAEATKKLERFERSARELQENLKRAESAEARATEKLRNLPAIEQELESLRLEHGHNISTIEHLQRRISEATAMVEAANKRAQAISLEAEKTLTAALQDHASNAKIELELSSERHGAVVGDLKEKLEREKERAKVAEMEMRGEQAVSCTLS